MSDVNSKTMSPQEKARYLLSQKTKVPSNNSPELWRKCLDAAKMGAFVQETAERLREARDRAEREALDKITADAPADADMSRYTEGGIFDAVRFIEDKRHYKTTWDGHILGMEDVLTVKRELAKGTLRSDIHAIVAKDQRERLKKQTEGQVNRINSQLGSMRQGFCKSCMNRGYTAYVENNVYIAFRICGCALQREKAAEERRRAEQENKKKKKKNGEKQDGTV